MSSVAMLRIAWMIAFVLLVCIAIGVACVFRLVYKRPTRTRTMLMKLTLLVFTNVFAFVIVELAFARIVVSDGFDVTLACRLWFDRYWHVNSKGYRDAEMKNLNKRVCYIVGDSVAAGHGIENAEDRFADRLTRSLGAEWEYVVIAQNGWNTPDELAATRKYPARPEMLVLSYFPNDIHAAAAAMGKPLLANEPWPTGMTKWIVNRSFFLNWAYWRVKRRSLGKNYWHDLRACYDDPAIWNRHAAEINQFAGYILEHKIKAVVIVWPSLTSIADSHPITSKVAATFESAGVRAIDLTPQLQSRRASELVVNDLDAHPNARTHAEIAQLLHEFLKSEGYLR